ncbi:MAG: HAMP domain-containing histidine kinase [Anaerolineaceae bacterium]|nr:HAMP domain-containing histidine kinase [Anaerolineaceae bacterium]
MTVPQAPDALRPADAATRLDDPERLDAEMRYMLYILSHDLRGPFITLRGFVEELRMIADDISDGLEAILPSLEPAQAENITMSLEELPEVMGFIGGAVDSLDSYMQRLLKLSRLGRTPQLPRWIEPAKTLAQVLADKSENAFFSQSTINIDTMPDVWADEESFYQLMDTAVTNACQYHQEGKAAEVNISASAEDGGILIHVKDNGRGINDVDLPRIFEPFFRAGRQNTPGEGMGLTYARLIMRMHKGKLWCESQVDGGTSLFMWLPLPINGTSL